MVMRTLWRRTLAFTAGPPTDMSARAHYFGADFFSTSAMRVCQPGPVAFHPAITSGGRRSERSCLGFGVGGRPRRTSFAPRRNSAPATHSFVISGASSLGEELTERFRFALMAVPHANDSPGCAAWRPDEYDQS